MRALITGGAGFIGSHIAEHLTADGHHQVRIVDNLSSGRIENLNGFADRVEFREGDIRDAQLMVDMARGCDVVFHQAALVSVPYSVAHPQESHDVNLQGTLNVLQAAKQAGVKRVVYACSAAVYGEEPGLPKREDMRAAPISPYGIEKMTGEYYCAVFDQLYGVQTVSLRYFNVFGPRQDPSSPYSGVISVFVSKILAGQQPTIFGNGEQYRDFVYVDNVVQANLRAATESGVAGRCYNVGCGQKTTLNDLVTILGRIVGHDVTPHHAAERPGDIRESIADISRAREELGYDPSVSVDEGLHELVAWEQRESRE